MGCDIHTHLEYKKRINGKEKWVCADHFRLNPYHNGIDIEEPKYELVGFCDNRDYGLFATLANVRNYGDTKYIDNPRGLPRDVSKEVKEEYKEWGDDAHSCSYFTLKELIDFYNKEKKLRRSGLVSKEDAKRLDNDNTLPNQWCQATTLDWVYREWEEDNKSLKNLIDEIKNRTIEDRFIYDCDVLKDDAELKKVRLVFWFDN